VKRTFGFEVNVRSRAIADGLVELLVVSLDKIGDSGLSRLRLDPCGFGMMARRTRQRTTDPIASPHGIQGDISVVIDATNEAISSAT
jgi:hypothetical protein